MHGKQDAIVALASSNAAHAKFSSGDKGGRVVLFPGAGHNLFGEHRIAPQVILEIGNWILARTPLGQNKEAQAPFFSRGNSRPGSAATVLRSEAPSELATPIEHAQARLRNGSMGALVPVPWDQPSLPESFATAGHLSGLSQGGSRPGSSSMLTRSEALIAAGIQKQTREEKEEANRREEHAKREARRLREILPAPTPSPPNLVKQNIEEASARLREYKIAYETEGSQEVGVTSGARELDFLAGERMECGDSVRSHIQRMDSDVEEFDEEEHRQEEHQEEARFEISFERLKKVAEDLGEDMTDTELQQMLDEGLAEELVNMQKHEENAWSHEQDQGDPAEWQREDPVQRLYEPYASHPVEQNGHHSTVNDDDEEPVYEYEVPSRPVGNVRSGSPRNPRNSPKEGSRRGSKDNSPRASLSGSPTMAATLTLGLAKKGKKKGFADLPPERLLPTGSLNTADSGRGGNHGDSGLGLVRQRPHGKRDLGSEMDFSGLDLGAPRSTDTDGSDCDVDAETEMAKAQLAALETQAIVEAQARRRQRILRVKDSGSSSPRTAVRATTEIYQEKIGEPSLALLHAAGNVSPRMDYYSKDYEQEKVSNLGSGHAEQRSHLGSLLFS